MSELDLFGSGDAAGGGEGPRQPGPGASDREARSKRGREKSDGPETESRAPLAARVRPRSLDEFLGQEQLLGEGKALRVMMDRGEIRSMILWGPPGSGKTTLARLMAERTDAAFEPFSAVTEGIARVREIIEQARQRRAVSGRSTILFCDEIHRFNKAQQDAFLPHVEEGTVVLIGATTENPSFEVVRPLLSRAPVFVLEPLDEKAIERILRNALGDARGLDGAVKVTDDAVRSIAVAADGDARRALGVLDAAAHLVGSEGTVDTETAREAVQHRFAVYDKSGEEHYNLISALHKAIRGSDPDGALYWLARMLEGGEDPLYLARRLVRMASEDVGMADPGALRVALAARDAYHFLGSPEGDLALAQAVVHLAAAPKSNRIYAAWKEARRAARDTPSAPVPLHIRNAPTELMKELGYGEGYRYDPDEPGGVAAQRYLPDVLEGRRFYRPGRRGEEAGVAERLREAERRRSVGPEDASGAHGKDPTGGESERGS